MPTAEDFEGLESRYMEMPSGKRFYMANPEFDIEDIAFTIARQPRFNGTSSKFISVAEHCVRVSYLIAEMDSGTPIEGLCHDVTEAYLGDVPGPWKILLPDFVELETYLWINFTDWLLKTHNVDIPHEHSPGLKRADWWSLMIEAREVMKSQGKGWHVPPDVPSVGVLDMPCYFWEPEEAEARFLNRFYELVW